MSKTVEERIVEMRFDNKQFESGVKQTRESIAQLNEDLKFKNAVDGIQNVQSAFSRLDFSAVLKGFDNFKVSLSGMEVFTKRIIENLADSLYGAVQKVSSGLTAVFRQIDEGGARRAQNIEQAKFQLEGLGIAWEDIKGDIDYAVSGTAYGLDVAARAASQLVASNVQLGEEMKFSLRGISGLAAMTNSSYEDIASIFTKVAGQGRMMGEDLNRIAARGINAAAELAKAFGVTESEIRDMVSKGQIDFKTFAKAMDDAFGEHAKDANKTYAGSLSNVKAALSRIGADIKTAHFETLRQIFVDLIPKLNEFKKAFKPVENIIIEVEAALGRLTQKVISMVDVTKLVNKIAKPVEKVGKKILEVIDIITEALDQVDAPMKVLKDFAYVSREAAMEMKGFGDAVKYTSKAEEKATEYSEDMQKALQAAKDIWTSGKYGNGQERIDALEAAGIDSKKTQAIIEEFIKNGYDWDAAIKKVSEDTGEAVDENTEKAKKLNNTIQTLAHVFRNIKRIFKNVATSVGNVVSALFKAITGSMSDLHIGDVVVKITDILADLSDKFVITKEKAEKLTKPVKLILDILKKFVKVAAGVIKALGKIIFNVGKLIYTLGNRIISSKDFNDFFTSLSDGIGELITNIKKLVNDISKSESLQKFFKSLKVIGSTAIKVFGGFILGIVNLLNFVVSKIKSFGEIIASFFDFKSDKFDKLIENVEKTTDKFSFFKRFIINMVKTLRNALKGVVNLITNLFTAASDGTFDALLNNIRDKVMSFMDKAQELTKMAVEWFKGFFITIIDQIKKLTGADIRNLIKDSLFAVVIFDTIKLYRGLSKLINGLPSLITGISSVLTSTAKVNKSIARLNTAKIFTEIGKTVLMFAASLTLIVGSIVTLAEYIEKSDKAKEAFDYALGAVSDIMGNVALVILSWIALSKTFDLATAVFTSKSKLHVPMFLQLAAIVFAIGYTMKALINSIDKLSKIPADTLSRGTKRLIEILKIMGIFFTALTLVTALINRFIGGGADDVTRGLWAISLVVLSIAASIDLMVVAIAAIAGLNKLFGANNVALAIESIEVMMGVITVCLAGLFASMALLRTLGQTQDMSKVLLGVAAIFVAIALMFDLLIPVIASIAGMIKLFPEETFIAIGVVAGLIAEIMTFAALVGGNANKNSAGLMKWVAATVAAFVLLTWSMQNLADHIQSEEQMYAVVGSLMGIAAIVLAMAQVVRNLGSNKLKWYNILSVAGLFVSLTAIIFSLKALSTQSWDQILTTLGGVAAVVFAMQYVMRSISKADTKWQNIVALAAAFGSLSLVIAALYHVAQQPVENIIASLAGLSLVIMTMAALLERLNNENIKPGNIAALGVAFLGLATILVPLIWLKGENMGALAVALGGLSVFVVAFGAMMKLLNQSLTGWQIISTGLSIAAIAAGMSLLTWTLCAMSTEVDINSLVKIAITIGVLAAVFTALGIVLSKYPVAIAAVIGVAGAILLIGGAIVAVIWAVGALMDMFPDLMTSLQEFAYTLGTLPGFIVKGFIDGLCEAFPKVGKVIRKLIGEDVIEPAADTLQTHSPSKVFEALGKFTGLGFEEGLKESFSNMDLSGITDIKDKISSELPDGFSLGEGLGDNILNGLTDSFNLDSLGFDTSQFNINMDGFTEAFQENTAEQLRGVNLSDLYSLEDLLADSSLYDKLKAAGETQLTAAYEDWQHHAEFMSKYPTVQSWYDDMANNYEDVIVEAYRKALAEGDKEMQQKIEAGMLQNYLDQSKLNAATYQYMETVKDSIEKSTDEVFSEDAAADIFKTIGDRITSAVNGNKTDSNFIGPVKKDVLLNMKVQDDTGKNLDISSIQNGSVNLDYDNSSVKTNMDAVSSDVTSAINEQTTKLSERLTAIETKVGTFDTNNLNRTNNLINRIAQLEGAISQMRIQLDTGALVGQLIDPIDEKLGAKSVRKARG